MKQRESSFGTLFRHYLLANPPKLSATYELKQTPSDSIPFSCLEDHQIDASMTVKWGKKGYLIRNESGTVGAPDYSYYYNSPAYIVIKYPSGFVVIDIETWTEEKKRSKRKSLTWDRACAIAGRVIKLK
jgi:hypothetical protein